MPMTSSKALYSILGVAVVGSTIAVGTNAMRSGGDYAFFDPIVDVHTMIEQLYVEDPSEKDLQLAAINGMLEELGDPFSVYVPHEQTERFSRDLTGEYVGIGAEVNMNDGWLTISSPLDGSPAWRAGVMAGDRVIGIDGESTEGKTLDELIGILIGEPKTAVTITVKRGVEELDIEIVRDHIKVQAVKGFMRGGGGEGAWEHLIDEENKIAYIRLTQFTPKCADEVRDAIEAVRVQVGGTLGGVILDLRYNPGGLLDEAVSIADLFLDEGMIVSTKGRAYEGHVSKAHSKGTLDSFPLVVLVNGQSASASEVLSGALADQDRAVVIGTRSFGKGSVQSVRELPSKAGVLKLTEQYYYLPSGRLLHRRDDSTVWGVDPTPGYYLAMSNEEQNAMLIARREQEVLSKNDDEFVAVDIKDTEAVLDRLDDPQLSAAVGVMAHRIKTGEFEPVGIEPNTPDDVALASLNTLRDQRERLVREVIRIDRRVQAVSEGVSEERVDENPNDLWDDDILLKGGVVVIRDAEGKVVSRLRITGENLELWLMDADVEKVEEEAEIEEPESVSP
ncbi:MAG: S41 family peptidase [Phycisphaerales bacterium]|nr:S41 family peptidase [Phycisphaerales bacterium]